MSNSAVSTVDSLLIGDIQDWVSTLPQYQGDLIKQMLTSQSPEEVAISWLTSSGPADTAPFGAIRAGASLYYINLLRELQKLLCGNTEYQEERKTLATLSSTSKLAIVSLISTAIAPNVGGAAVVIAPVVTIALGLLASAGRSTACEALDTAITNQIPTDSTDSKQQ